MWNTQVHVCCSYTQHCTASVALCDVHMHTKYQFKTPNLCGNDHSFTKENIQAEIILKRKVSFFFHRFVACAFPFLKYGKFANTTPVHFDLKYIVNYPTSFALSKLTCLAPPSFCNNFTICFNWRTQYTWLAPTKPGHRCQNYEGNMALLQINKKNSVVKLILQVKRLTNIKNKG